jgi:hypothetical protein
LSFTNRVNGNPGLPATNQYLPPLLSKILYLSVVQLFARPQQAEDDVRELAQAIPTADAIVVNINDIQNNYDMLIDESYSLFVELSKDPSAFC